MDKIILEFGSTYTKVDKFDVKRINKRGGKIMKKFENIFWGILLIVIGVIIGGNALGITNINIFF